MLRRRGGKKGEGKIHSLGTGERSEPKIQKGGKEPLRPGEGKVGGGGSEGTNTLYPELEERSYRDRGGGGGGGGADRGGGSETFRNQHHGLAGMSSNKIHPWEGTKEKKCK